MLIEYWETGIIVFIDMYKNKIKEFIFVYDFEALHTLTLGFLSNIWVLELYGGNMSKFSGFALDAIDFWY